MTTLIAWCAFGLASAVLLLRPKIESEVALGEWGSTVLRRASRAAWIIWGGLGGVHALFWAFAHDLRLGIYPLTIGLLIAALRARRELSVWAAVAAAIGISFLEPAAVSTTALMGALVLGFCSRRGLDGRRVRVPAIDLDDSPHPYRAPAAPEEEGAAAEEHLQLKADPRRMYVGTIASAYLAAWTFGWQGGALPAHLLWLDLGVTMLLLTLCVRMRLLSAGIAAAAIWFHHGVQSGVLAPPRSTLQWGVVLVSTGFLLLLAGLAVNWKLRKGMDVSQDGAADLDGG